MASVNSFPMNGGTGARSYAQNSSYQRGASDVAKPIIEEEIAKNLSNIKELVKNGVLIADFGSSTGHNSFPAVEIIIRVILQIYESAEFHVFFNDVVSNDFNTLFASLPPHRTYHATGVPGDFHGRLLPKSCLHFAYSSWSLQWLTQVPKAEADSASPAWKNLCAEKRKEVRDAYLDQYSKDMGAFLESRAVEMVDGGIMALLVPGFLQLWDPQINKLLGSVLVDMAKMGRVSEEKIDTFNSPCFYPTPQQFKDILERNNNFSIERMEILDNIGKYNLSGVDAHTAFRRAVNESMLTHHFGGEIIDELFDLYKKKLAASPVLLDPESDKSVMILAMIKRKAD